MNRRNFLKGFLAATTVAALAPTTLVELPVTEATKFVSFEEIARITLDKYRPVFANAILSSPNVFFRFKNSNSVGGGIAIVEPIIRDFNPVNIPNE